jgi:hypothetical protein
MSIYSQSQLFSSMMTPSLQKWPIRRPPRMSRRSRATTSRLSRYTRLLFEHVFVHLLYIFLSIYCISVCSSTVYLSVRLFCIYMPIYFISMSPSAVYLSVHLVKVNHFSSVMKPSLHKWPIRRLKMTSRRLRASTSRMWR